MSFLLDTSVVSEARRPSGAAQVRAWLQSVDAADLYLSVLVAGEIQRGVERLRRRDPAQAAVFDAWLSRLRRDSGERIIPITTDIAEEWGRMNVSAPIPTVDDLMAATAKVRDVTLVTRNTADVARTGVPLLNPFERES